MITATTHQIDIFEDFERLKVYCEKVKSEYLCFDIETDSEIEKKANLYGLGFCLVPTRIFYLVWRNNTGRIIWSEDQQVEIITWFFELCKSKKLIAHNGIYDTLVLEYNWGTNISPYLYHDTILSAHTINEEGPFGLKDLGTQYFGEDATKEQSDLKESVLANGGKWTKVQKDMYKSDTSILSKYCIQDVKLTYDLFKIYDKKLKEEELEEFFYEKEVMPLYQVTIDMKRKGFTIDLDYFKNLKKEVETRLITLEDEIISEIQEDIKPFINKLLDKHIKINNAGSLPKAIAEMCNIPLPVTKDGKITLSAKALDLQKQANMEDAAFYDWISAEEVSLPPISPEILRKVREKMLIDKLNNAAQKKDKQVRYAFNLNSSDHLGYYFFTIKGLVPLKTTEKGKKQVNAAFIDSLLAADPKIQKILDFKKLQKLLGTYITGIIKRQFDGVIYSSFLQFGTTSGRYSCTNPNLQNLPRIKEDDSGLSELVLHYVNAIKRGFIAPKGYKIVNADYSSLEPVCFGHVSNSEGLRDIFRTGKDLYSQVAIDVNKLQDQYSADKKAPNFLKKHRPELRQLWKVPVLGIVYGMEEARLMQSIGCDRKTATSIIRGYLSTYPDLKTYMYSCEISAKKLGYVKTEMGRVRHLPEVNTLYEKYGDRLLDWKFASAKGLLQERRKFKTLLNNSKNFPIQGLASSLVNRAMIAIYKKFKAEKLDAWIVGNVHDEITCIARDDHVKRVSEILQECMEKTNTISIPLVAVPVIGMNWAEAK